MKKTFTLASCLFAGIVCGYAAKSSNKIKESDSCRCLPSQPCWPDKDKWVSFKKSLKGDLIKPSSVLKNCESDGESKECKNDVSKIKNPFYMQSDAGRSENQGWYNAWKDTPSTYAVEAKNTDDVVKAVNFARENNLRLVIKGAGHDYLGRSSSKDSLMIWTHNMRDIVYNKHFHPANCPKSKEYTAVTVGAGTRWLEAYDNVTNKHHKYVQGGGCTTVGAAGGFTQGGGFGSWTKQYGTGAAGVLQAEVVTADGKVVVANECQNQDLFWAIKGGGGGTYGVVTKLTLRVHDLPKYFGLMTGEIVADNDDAYKELIKRFISFYSANLTNPNWGEQFLLKPDNKFGIAMVTQNLTKEQALNVWKPFISWVKKQQDLHINTKYIDIPPTKIWNYDFWHKNHPDMVKKNTGPDARDGEYWWATNTAEIFSYWYTYQSWYLPKSLFDKKNIAKTADTFYKASRLGDISISLNKGMSGASKEATELTKQTSMDPRVFDANALVIMSSSSDKPVLGKSDIPADKKKEVDNIYKAMEMIEALAPQAGSYANEADYFQKDWQNIFWGSNYKHLLSIKNKYDPKGLFYCHHCVGSEEWQEGGMCKK